MAVDSHELGQAILPLQKTTGRKKQVSNAVDLLQRLTSQQADNHNIPVAYAHGTQVLSFVALKDDDKAARLKRNLHSTFTTNGVLSFEPHVDHTVLELVGHLNAAGSSANLAQWMSWFAIDTIARIAFSEDQGFMKQQQDVGGAMQAGQRRFDHWNFYFAIPWLDGILYKNWWVRNSKRPASALMRLALRAIETRKLKGGLGSHHDLLDLYMSSAERDPELYTPAVIVC
ncbi:hypothetical protein LTR17_018301 [Elasticomyces elasticus]|nr:hypothetical protein LTR17_018301 [Elasticomyces elasticus]